MRLHMSLTSPYARKVRIAVIELGLEDAVEPVLVDPHNDERFRSVTPLSKVPALELDDGRVLFESLLLLEFLDAHAGGGRLFPVASDPARRDVLARHALANGLIDAAVAIVMEGRRPEALRSADAVRRQEAAIIAGLRWAERDAPAADAPFDAGTVTLVAALEYLDLRRPTLRWRDEQPRLAAWHEAIADRPAVARTRPPG